MLSLSCGTMGVRCLVFKGKEIANAYHETPTQYQNPVGWSRGEDVVPWLSLPSNHPGHCRCRFTNMRSTLCRLKTAISSIHLVWDLRGTEMFLMREKLRNGMTEMDLYNKPVSPSVVWPSSKVYWFKNTTLIFMRRHTNF